MASNKPKNLYDSINNMLESTQWNLMKPGRPKRINLGGYEFSQQDLEAVMNHYRSVGWIVRASVMIKPDIRNYTLEFVNPHHN